MTKKKKILVFSAIGTILLVAVLLSPYYIYRLFYLLTQYEYTIDGIQNYMPQNSDVELTWYLTLRDEDKVLVGHPNNKKDFFCNKYSYSEAFYRCEKKHKNYTIHETVVMALTYDNTNYENACEDITSQKGFSDEITFNYKSFSFFLNDTERLLNSDNHHTIFCLSCNDPYIGWINLVGYDDDSRTIVFVGFYHCEHNGAKLEKKHYYDFVDWETFFSENFSYYEF